MKKLRDFVKPIREMSNDGVNTSFKAIFVTGGPGSGKDIIIRNALNMFSLTELNFTQAKDYLSDKHRLSEKTQDFRKEAIRLRESIIINGPADDYERVRYIKEELEELGYSTMMIFVSTTDETSQERNAMLSKMMVESVRQDKWNKSQQNRVYFSKIFESLVVFDNTGSIETKDEDIYNINEYAKVFLNSKSLNESAMDWIQRNDNLDDKFEALFKESKNDSKNNKSGQKTVGKGYNSYMSAKSPADIAPDNRSGVSNGQDAIKGNTNPRKNPNGVTYTFGSGAGVYAESSPTLTFSSPPKEPNFQQDNDKLKKKKRGDRSLTAAKVGKPPGIGPEYDTRAGGQGAAAGAGLGNQTYSEDREYSNAQPSSAAMPGSSALQPNPLSNDYDKIKKFKYFRKLNKEAIDDPGANDMGVAGVMGGAGNKEGMDSYKDPMRNVGIQIIKKNLKKGAKNVHKG